MLLSLAIAFALWAFVVTVVSPESEETYYNVPVILDGQNVLEERNLMIVPSQEHKATVSLSGYRTDLNKLTSSNIALRADLSVINEPGEHRLNYTVSYPGISQTGTIHVLNKDPQYITLTVVEREQKEIPVQVVFNGNLPENFTADRQNVQLDHSTVTVSGPKAVIEKIDHAQIVMDLNNQTNTISQVYRHTLCGEDGEPIADVSMVTVNVSDIRATLTVRKLKDIPLKLEILPGGGITEEMIVVTLERDSITVSGSAAVVDSLEEIVIGSVNLAELSGDLSKSYDIVLPEGLINVTGVTAVKVDVKMPVMKTRRMIVTNFENVNLPGQASVTYITEQLVVDIRGPETLVDALQSENIVALVDFSGAKPGKDTYTATIEIRDFEGVGAVGTYTVVVEIGIIGQEAQN